VQWPRRVRVGEVGDEKGVSCVPGVLIFAWVVMWWWWLQDGSTPAAGSSREQLCGTFLLPDGGFGFA
jgi:hypothetical protein